MFSTKQFKLSDCSIYQVIRYLNSIRENIKEIRLKYIWTVDSLNLNDDTFETIFDEVDEEISGIFNSLCDFENHIYDYEDYFDKKYLNLKIKFQYTECYNGYDSRVAEIRCLRYD